MMKSALCPRNSSKTNIHTSWGIKLDPTSHNALQDKWSCVGPGPDDGMGCHGNDDGTVSLTS